MQNVSRRNALPLLCLLLLTSLGCYTVIKHPRVHAERGAESDDFASKVAFGDDCQSCHNAGVNAFHSIAVPPPRPAPSWRWEYYYDTPWWASYYAPAAGGGQASESETQKRAFDRRRTAQPEESTPPALTPSEQPPALPATGAISRPNANDDSGTAEPTQKEDSGKRRAKRGSAKPNNKKE